MFFELYTPYEFLVSSLYNFLFTNYYIFVHRLWHLNYTIHLSPSLLLLPNPHLQTLYFHITILTFLCTLIFLVGWYLLCRNIFGASFEILCFFSMSSLVYSQECHEISICIACNSIVPRTLLSPHFYTICCDWFFKCFHRSFALYCLFCCISVPYHQMALLSNRFPL